MMREQGETKSFAVEERSPSAGFQLSMSHRHPNARDHLFYSLPKLFYSTLAANLARRCEIKGIFYRQKPTVT